VLPDVCDPQATYGLPFSNYDTAGVINPETELEASLYESLAVDVAAASHTVPRAIVHVHFAAGAPSVYAYDSVWGNDPTIYPAVTDGGVGIVTLTWLAGGYADLNPTPARRVTRAPNFRFVQVQPQVAGMSQVAWTANTVTIAIFDHTHAAADNDFIVFVY
jgi:hypothetical protein